MRALKILFFANLPNEVQLINPITIINSLNHSNKKISYGLFPYIL